MNGYKISITDIEHLGCFWLSPAPFEIRATATKMGETLDDAPVVVHMLAGTTPARSAALLREVADALERNAKKWLPEIELGYRREKDELQSHLDNLAERGRIVDVTSYADDDMGEAETAISRYREQTPRTGYSPCVRLEIAGGTPPEHALRLLAEITEFVKSDIQAQGPATFEPVKPVAADDSGVPF